MGTEKFQNLRNQLAESVEFPSPYMFKFIIPADNRKLGLIENLFEGNAQINLRQSSQKKYISITAKMLVLSVDEVISIYEKAAAIEGVMSL